VPQEDLARGARGEPSEAIRERVTAARGRQLERQGRANALLSTGEVERHCTPDAQGAAMLAQAVSRLGFSARAYHRVLRVARTIADLAGARGLAAAHVAEAIQYRRFDRVRDA
jgi:magnesium chelatase family protein